MKEAEEKAARAEGGDFSFILDETRGHTVMTDSEFERLKEETSVKGPKLSSYHGNHESDFATTEEDEDEQGFGGLAGDQMFELFEGGSGFVFAIRVLPVIIFFSSSENSPVMSWTSILSCFKSSGVLEYFTCTRKF